MFQKGKSGNPAGRPKNFVDLRALAKTIGDEQVRVWVDDGRGWVTMTRTEAILREWVTSGKFERELKFFEYAYGRVPDRVESVNVDLANLTDEQLERLANGETVNDVLD